MEITLKLYATLSGYLPPTAVRNVTTLDVAENASVGAIIEQLHLPRELVHLVLVNGVYVPPEQRLDKPLKATDVLAIWPPIAGG